jgi:putative hydrolase of the HAD superfamily
MDLRIRAVLFDIYGTLLVSNTGSIHPDPVLREAIARAHAASPHPHPEVDIREIHAALRPELSAAEIEALAMEQECALNPVTAMPGAMETLLALKGDGVAIGLVSNAQFYTVPVLEKALGAGLKDLGIDPGLCRFSYLMKRAKPDPVLCNAARSILARRGVRAKAVLYVGNDVRNDIEPARKAGFITALFAGDSQSLRLHGQSLDEVNTDWILDDLRELPDLVRSSVS